MQADLQSPSFLLFNYFSAGNGGSAANPAQLLALTVSGKHTKPDKFHMRQVLFISIFLMTMTSFAQDSTAVAQPDGFKKWTKYRTSLRLGLGIQNQFYTEVGASRHKYIYNDLGYASSAKYLSLEVCPQFNTKQNAVYGLKVGYEVNTRVLALGL